MSDSLIVQISFDSGVSFESLLATQLGSDMYCLEESPLVSETNSSFKDVIEVEKDESGRLIFHRIILKAEFQTHRWAVSQQIIGSPEFKVFCNSVMQLGGMWECAIGGLLIVHLPRDVLFDPKAEIERISQIVSDNP